ncbi:hypothetical protein [Shewanella baltica]|nr:hypothetical protein [Shewanella baltica]MCS6175337.1 hypothetical protein [Shewanella baltica]
MTFTLMPRWAFASRHCRLLVFVITAKAQFLINNDFMLPTVAMTMSA